MSVRPLVNFRSRFFLRIQLTPSTRNKKVPQSRHERSSKMTQTTLAVRWSLSIHRIEPIKTNDMNTFRPFWHFEFISMLILMTASNSTTCNWIDTTMSHQIIFHSRLLSFISWAICFAFKCVKRSVTPLVIDICPSMETRRQFRRRRSRFGIRVNLSFEHKS